VRSTEEFQYLAVLISIVLGLGITQLLTGVGRLVQARTRVAHYWVVTLWIGLLLLIHVQSWWAMFDMRDHRGWTFGKFLLVLLHPSSLYMMAALALPDVAEATGEDGRRLDLRAHYHAQARWFFGALALVIVCSLLRPVVMDGHFPLDLDRVMQLLFLGPVLAATVVRREWYHRGLAVGAVAFFSAYVVLLFGQLR
jgi:hypothetical protein